MILNSIDTQFKLAEDGTITWQRDLTDPRAGEAVAKIKKGESVLAPSCDLLPANSTAEEDVVALQKFIEGWLHRHVQATLEPLFKLKEDDIAQGAPYEIAQKLYEALGILPREELQDLIGAMDEDGRNTLRSKKIRFGPIIVYLPELNKPAMVRLRALLLTLWQDKSLPAEAPNDGIVSFSVEGKELDADYYRSIGYPIYGPRSIRVDMLDRLICRVYDSADKGKFRAEHQMAEWLGSNIPDLYAVLEAMGHKKIYDPADEVKEEELVSEENSLEEKSEPIKEQVKPELATFILKSNKSSKPKVENFKKKKDFKKKDKKSKNKFEPRQKIYTAEAETNPEDNPFAVLQQLKSGNKE
jgi:ATP-dependent RNA helicase SUPV3L1/SUV3